MITKADALQSLRPGAEWVLRGDELEWLDTKQKRPTDAEINAEVKRLEAEQPAKEARAHRDRLLSETDWVSIKYSVDMNTNVPTEWLEYRQALRDITEQSGFPNDIQWPEKPSEAST